MSFEFFLYLASPEPLSSHYVTMVAFKNQQAGLVIFPFLFKLNIVLDCLVYVFCRAVYEELGKYGDLENQVLCRERVEELEPSIRYCRHKIGESNLQTSELLQIGEVEGPALDLFKAKLEVRLVNLAGSFQCNH